MPTQFFKKYKVSLETITPIFIGSGEMYYPNEYFKSSNEEIYIVDFDKLFTLLRQKNINFEDIIKNKKYQVNIEDGGKGFSIGKFIEDYNIPPKIVSSSKFKLKYDSGFLDTLPPIKKFIKDGNGNYFIPGSSLKGCFRTLYIWEEFYEDKSKIEDKKRKIEDLVSKFKEKKHRKSSFKKELRKIGEEIEKEPNKIFSKIRFSDFYFKDYNVFVVQISRIKTINEKRGIPQFVEAVVEGKAFGEIWIEGDINLSLEDFKEISKKFIDYLKTSKNTTAKIHLKALNQLSFSEEEMLIRLGFGKGFDFVTAGDWIKEALFFRGLKELFPNLKSKLPDVYHFPVSFWRTAYDNKPLGWVKLKFKQIA